MMMLTPRMVPTTPIKLPQIKNILKIDDLVNPRDRSMPISLPLFLTSIIRPEIIFIAAISTMSDSIKNITRRSRSKASKKAAVLSFQDQRKYFSANSSATVFLNSSTSNGFSNRTSIKSALLTLLKKV